METDSRGQPSEHDTGASDGQDPLAALFSEFARTVQQEDDAHATLVEIVRTAIFLIPGCDEASVCVVQGRGSVTAAAPSGELSRLVDAIQERFQQGPGLDAARKRATVRVCDMATETRWPQFTRAALAQGLEGMLSIQLYVESQDLGALNLFSRQRNAFSDESEHVGLMFAAHAAVAYAGACETGKLARRVITQQLIGQAQGILMERFKVMDHKAFAMLVKASQHTNAKLRDVAEQLVETGALRQPQQPPGA